MKTKILQALIILLAIFAAYGLGTLQNDTELLIETVQEQHWQLQDLEAELAYCEYHRGNEESIVLNSKVMRGMMK